MTDISAIKENSVILYQENIKGIVKARYYPSKVPIHENAKRKSELRVMQKRYPTCVT